MYHCKHNFFCDSGASNSSISESVTSVDQVVQITSNATNTSHNAAKYDIYKENESDHKEENCEDKQQETGSSKNEVAEDKGQKVDTFRKQDELEGKKTDIKSNSISK